MEAWGWRSEFQLVIGNYLEVFREIVRDPRWKDDFDLVARAIFDNLGNHLIGSPWPPCSTLNWERILQQLGLEVAVGTTQLYFDDTFMGANVGLESAYLESRNLDAAAKFQHAAVKMFEQLPTYVKDAAAKYCLQSK